MSSNDLLIYEAAGITLRIKLRRDQNPEIVDKVLEEIDCTGELRSVLGHAVISGQSFWLPTRIIYLAKGNMVPRTPGTVYFYAPGQAICFTYGDVTESSPVNKFAEIMAEDLPQLEVLGNIVYQKTVQNAKTETITVKIRRAGVPSPGLRPVEDLPTPDFKGDYNSAIAVFNHAIDKMWMEKPLDIQKIDLGISNTGAGTGQQMFSVKVHLKAHTMTTGTDIIFRFMQNATTPGMTLDLLKTLIQNFMFKPFSIPEFMTDLGLENMHKFGDMYVKALESVNTVDEFIALTGALLTYFTRTHRWIHLSFPWYLGNSFAHVDQADFIAVAKLLEHQPSARRLVE